MNPVQKIYHTDMCSICHDLYEKDQPNDSLLLKCGHVFHENCLKECIKRQPTCPLCESKVFIPILLKDLLKEAVQQGIEGCKKGAKTIVILTAIISGYAVIHSTLNYFFPGRWPTTEKEIDAYIEEHGVIFDFRKTEGYIKLGTTVLGGVVFAGTFYVVKYLNKRRMQPAEIAQRINYQPQ